MANGNGKAPHYVGPHFTDAQLAAMHAVLVTVAIPEQVYVEIIESLRLIETHFMRPDGSGRMPPTLREIEAEKRAARGKLAADGGPVLG